MTTVTILCPVSFAELRVGPSEVSVDCPRCAVRHDREFLRPRDDTPCSTCGHRRSAHGRHRSRSYACSLSTCGCREPNPKENNVSDLSYDHENLARELATELVLDGARDVEYLTVTEKLADRTESFDMDEDELARVAEAIDDLIPKATVTVEWPKTI